MPERLNNQQLRHLRGLCHALRPVVMVGQHGLSPAVLKEIELALDYHQLIKVKLRADREQREQWIQSIRDDAKATVVQQIGQVACFFRRNRERPQIAVPPERKAKPSPD